MTKEMDEMKSELTSGISNILFRQALKHMSPYSPETVKLLRDFVTSCKTDTCRIAVVRKDWELPIKTDEPCPYSDYMRAELEMLLAGFVQEVEKGE